MIRHILVGLAIALPAVPHAATAQAPSTAAESQDLREAAGAVVDILRGFGDFGAIFTPAFLGAVESGRAFARRLSS
ncbi:MAG: hypothetical protein JWL74_1703 [Alphaproteobacteria bacterium]|jgi:hypothetical protein|nr:hypothetical protein [Alphaproteobacteria bacterium]